MDKDQFFEEIYSNYYDQLAIFCRNKIRTYPFLNLELEDVIQETMQTALEKYNKLVEHENIMGWLVKTCDNKINNALKKAARRGKQLTILSIDKDAYRQVADRRDRLARWLSREESKEIIEVLYKSLTQMERQVFDQYYIHDHKMVEIAESQGISLAAVKKALHRIRSKARDQNKFFVFLLFWVSFELARKWIK